MIIKLPSVRISFPVLFKAKAFNGQGEPAYSAAFLIPKGSKLHAEIDAAMLKVAREKWGDKAALILQNLAAPKEKCFYNGDVKDEYEGFKGNMVLSARSTRKPVVTDRDKNTLTQEDGRPYSGCYVHASARLWAQDNAFGKGLRAELRAVMFARDGDAFAGGAPASDDEFDDLSVDSTEDALM